eukprot:2808156-Rhodomonas_salina.2
MYPSMLILLTKCHSGTGTGNGCSGTRGPPFKFQVGGVNVARAVTQSLTSSLVLSQSVPRLISAAAHSLLALTPLEAGAAAVTAAAARITPILVPVIERPPADRH